MDGYLNLSFLPLYKSYFFEKIVFLVLESKI